jgi:hypothetical protein
VHGLDPVMRVAAGTHLTVRPGGAARGVSARIGPWARGNAGYLVDPGRGVTLRVRRLDEDRFVIDLPRPLPRRIRGLVLTVRWADGVATPYDAAVDGGDGGARDRFIRGTFGLRVREAAT